MPVFISIPSWHWSVMVIWILPKRQAQFLKVLVRSLSGGRVAGVSTMTGPCLCYMILTRGSAEFDTAAVKRQLGNGVFTAEAFSGKSVHVYLAFVSEDRKRRSNSQYLGVITVL